MYDHHTGLYHVMYQWHPNHFGWGKELSTIESLLND